MSWNASLCGGLLMLTGMCAARATAAENPAARKQDEQAIRAAAKAYLAAAAKGDTKALAEFWTADGNFIDDQGHTHPASELIAEAQPVAGHEAPAETKITASDIRFLTADVAIEEGALESVPADGDGAPPTRGHYHAVWVKQGGRWRLTSLCEIPVVAPAAEPDLSDLDWMVGAWTAELPGEKIEVAVHWNATRTFLLRESKIFHDGKLVGQGSQRSRLGSPDAKTATAGALIPTAVSTKPRGPRLGNPGSVKSAACSPMDVRVRAPSSSPATTRKVSPARRWPGESLASRSRTRRCDSLVGLIPNASGPRPRFQANLELGSGAVMKSVRNTRLRAAVASGCCWLAGALLVQAQQPAPKKPAAAPKAPAAAPKAPASPTAPSSAGRDSQRRAEILASEPWRLAMFELEEWFRTQTLYTPEEAAKMRSDFIQRVNTMSPDELQRVIADTTAKFQILDSPEVRELRAWFGQYVSVLADRKREELLQAIPNFATMTASELSQEIAKKQLKRQGRQSAQSRFDEQRQTRVTSQLEANRAAAMAAQARAAQRLAYRASLSSLVGTARTSRSKRTPARRVAIWGRPDVRGCLHPARLLAIDA